MQEGHNIKVNPDFHFTATGIGSVPSTDIRETCHYILDRFSRIPYWPQFVKRSHFEDMCIQFSEGLPLLKVDEQRRTLTVSEGEREAALLDFYEHLLAEDLSYFAVTPAYAPGLYTIIESVEKQKDRFGAYIKGHTVGPVTFAAGIADNDGKSILYDPELMEALVKGLAIKALWQITELERTGKKPIIFFDEPSLSGFGSAFSSIQRHEVIGMFREIFQYLRERSDALLGIHCCGNTDWSMILEPGPDIVNFDAFGYLDYFLLYPEEISRFIRNGGIIAWGIVPTLEFTGKETLEDLTSRLQKGMDRFYEWGLDPETLKRCSLLTPACGLGSMDQVSADRALDLLSRLSAAMQ